MSDVPNLAHVYDMTVPGHYSTKDFTFFWAGPFSNWHKSPFEMKDLYTDDIIRFNCSEQAMMYFKAMEFGDTKSAKQIMKTSDPSKQKKLGRGVSGYVEEHWKKVRMTQASFYLTNKFLQNYDLLGILLDTEEREIVEASPYDCVWGCGMGVDKYPQILDKSQWTGTNLLGVALMQVREDLKIMKDTVAQYRQNLKENK